MKRLLLVAVLVVLAGCGSSVPGGPGSASADGIGEVDGVTDDSNLDIDTSDGFTEAELEQFVDRSMARIEVVRDLNYERPVDVTIVNRSAYREQYLDRVTGPTRDDWENQIWRGLFIVGQDRDATDVLDEAFGGSVQGFYEPGRNSIVIVSDSETPTVRKSTLIHELTHALQDQQFGLAFGQETRDRQAAYDTLIEGEAELVPQLYLDRCGSEWSCVRPEVDSGQAGNLDRGIAQIITQPYRQGVGFVEHLRAEGGWEAVNDAHENPPESTAQTVHPERYPGDTPEDVTVPDRSSADWDRFDQQPEGDTLGVVSIFAMFESNGIIQPDQPGTYDHPVTTGWEGDHFVPYRADGEFGYVWEIDWDSNSNAAQFADAYRELLDEHGGLERGIDRYVVEEGPFAGAYRLTVEGDTVRIVSGPSMNALSAIHSS